MEELIDTIETPGRSIQIFKQHMWLIAAENNRELDRVEMFGKTEAEALNELKGKVL